MNKLVCQAITFQEKLTEDFEFVAEAIKKTGYDGMEGGFRRLSADKLPEYQETLKKLDLEFFGLHIGGDFMNPDSVGEELDKIPNAVKIAKTLGAKALPLSGRKNMEKPKEEYIREAEVVNELGRQLREEGLLLCYHNHDWEIVNDLRGIRTLCEYTDPKNVSLIPDIGWVVRGGADPIAFLKEFDSRIKHIHFKEFTAEGEITELGRGIVDFPAIYKYIADNNKDWQIVAEQDRTQIGAANSVTQNYSYIMNLIRG